MSMNSETRKAPRLLLGAALLFWGLETRHWYLAAVMAVVMEASGFFTRRWEFSAADFNRLWDATAIVCTAGVFYSFLSGRVDNGVIGFVKWFPLIFLPFTVAQSCAARNVVTLTTFSWLLRKRKPSAAEPPPSSLTFDFFYLAICLMAASAANVRNAAFYAGFCVIAGWALFPSRNRAISRPAWGLCLAVVIPLGYGGQIVLHALQAIVENKTGNLFSDMDMADLQRWQSRTSIGSIGELKFSDRVVLRVRSNGRNAPPDHLRESTFNTYESSARNSRWLVSARNFHSIASDPERANSWNFIAKKDADTSISIAAWLHYGTGVLALPTGAWRVERLPVTVLSRSGFGIVRVEGGPELVHYTVRYGPGESMDAPPDDHDLQIPEGERPGIEKVASELGLPGQSPEQNLETITKFFQAKFTYTRYLKDDGSDAWGKSSPVSHFLERSRSGHCEYFATATVLLLRAAGIHARYATGYSVQENGGKGLYIVRSRHAHAWCLAHVGGAWRDVDTTPASWADEEASANSTPWRPIADFFSAIWYKFSEWRWLGEKEGFNRVVTVLLLVAVAALAWKYFPRHKGWFFKSKLDEPPSASSHPGSDSEFYLVEKHLAAQDLGRSPEETLRHWLRRVEASPRMIAAAPPLEPILSLHCRYRFDPKGLTEGDRQSLRELSRSWIEGSRPVKKG